jgi:hypothetical protein
MKKIRLLIPTLALFLSSCMSPAPKETSVPTVPESISIEKPAEPAMPSPSEIGTAASHCKEGEKVVFNCLVEEGKNLSICLAGSHTMYRFGRLGQVELEYGGADKTFRLKEDEYGYTLSFLNNTHQYTVYEEDDGAEGGVEVTLESEKLREFSCLNEPMGEGLEAVKDSSNVQM